MSHPQSLPEGLIDRFEVSYEDVTDVAASKASAFGSNAARDPSYHTPQAQKGLSRGFDGSPGSDKENRSAGFKRGPTTPVTPSLGVSREALPRKRLTKLGDITIDEGTLEIIDQSARKTSHEEHREVLKLLAALSSPSSHTVHGGVLGERIGESVETRYRLWKTEELLRRSRELVDFMRLERRACMEVAMD